VIGIGTGRCGSTSLARLLDAQEGAAVTHEHAPVLGRTSRTSADRAPIRRLREQQRRHRLAGDVAHWWLPRLEALAEVFPALRVVVLKRDRQATVESFARVMAGAGGATPVWGGNRAAIGPHDIWRSTHPPSEPMEVREAVGRYRDRCYDEAERTLARSGLAHRAVATESLGAPETQRAVLDFLAVPRARQGLVADLRETAGTIRDGRGHHRRGRAGGRAPTGNACRTPGRARARSPLDGPRRRS